MSLKELKKLAATCRAAGIKSFKNNEIEFTLGDAPARSRRSPQKTQEQSPAIDSGFQSDELTQEQLLFYSTLEVPESSQ